MQSTTRVFSCFEAGDSVTNLHVSLDQYKDDIKDLRGMMWKYVLYYFIVDSQVNMFSDVAS